LSKNFLPPTYSVKDLLDDVWGHDRVVSPGTVQRTISHLRKKLHKAGMRGLKVDGSQRGHYALVVG
jgi:DNA-binding response OmpR family regulator